MPDDFEDLAQNPEIISPLDSEARKRKQFKESFTLPQAKTRPLARAMAAALQHNDGELLKDLIFSAIKHAIDGDSRFFEMILERIDGKLLAQAVGTGLTVEELEAAANPLEKVKLITERVRARLKGEVSVQ
jgi:hypothetical protein